MEEKDMQAKEGTSAEEQKEIVEKSLRKLSFILKFRKRGMKYAILSKDDLYDVCEKYYQCGTIAGTLPEEMAEELAEVLDETLSEL